jgi:hemoglobin/transferrin/lactoferrin receptor protein
MHRLVTHSRHRRRSAVAATGCCLLALCGSLVAGERSLSDAEAKASLADAAAAQEPGVNVLPEVKVQATRQRPSVQADPTRSATTIGEAVLRQRQPDSVFEVLDEVPGVSVQGGPRSSGMSFNIRGYTDGEDVRIELDGVGKGFEKYRFGGTFIEPELLKSIEVRRGAQVESPAGALGGTVSAQTRDAADLLRPGQRWGARTRIGHASNNDETQALVAAYGRPSDQTDLVVARSRRVSNDLKLANGDRLSLSETDAGSTLVKGSWWLTDQWKAALSWVRYQDQGLQPYDTTGGEPGTFGQVQRRIDDDTLSLQTKWANEDTGAQWLATIGRSQTRVRDHMEKGWSVFSTLASVDDDVDHRHSTWDTRWSVPLTGRVPASSTQVDETSVETPNDGPWRMSLHLGLQGGHNERTARRVTGSALLNQFQYPDGYNPAQPPGSQDRVGGYAQLDLRHGGWQALPGLRWDRFTTRVIGANAKALLAAGQSDEITSQRASPSLTLAHTWAQSGWTVFGTAARAFRPPLLDEAFARSAYGGCNNASLLRLSDGGVPGYASNARVAPQSGICADFYEPEVSRSWQVGVQTHQSGAFGLGADSALDAKLTAFDDRTRQLLESLMVSTDGSGQLTQPGTEHRWGIELEAGLRWQTWQARLSGHRMRGRSFDGLRERPLLTVPADRLQLSLGWRQPWGELGLRWQQVWARAYFQDNTRTRTGRQPSHRLLGAWAQWRLSQNLSLDLAAENLANASYRLDNGFASEGVEGAGRNLRVALSARY